MSAEVPYSDKGRRGQILQSALNQSVCKCIRFDEKTNIAQPNFFYFGVIVGPAGFAPVLDGDKLKLGLPADLPFAQPRALRSGERAGSASVHIIPLNAPVEVQVVAMLLPGNMTVPISFTSPARSS